MYKILLFVVIGLICSLLVSPAWAQPKGKLPNAPAEDPPQILVAAAIDSDDRLVLVTYHSIFIGFDGTAYNERLTRKVSLQEVQILTADGMPISVAEARKRIANQDTPILVNAYKKPVPKFYAAMFAAETMQFVFPKKPPRWKEIEAPGAPIDR